MTASGDPRGGSGEHGFRSWLRGIGHPLSCAARLLLPVLWLPSCSAVVEESDYAASEDYQGGDEQEAVIVHPEERC